MHRKTKFVWNETVQKMVPAPRPNREVAVQTMTPSAWGTMAGIRR